MAVLLVGFNWFSTFKTFKQEKQELIEKILLFGRIAGLTAIQEMCFLSDPMVNNICLPPCGL
jgi:hypothetical protein